MYDYNQGNLSFVKSADIPVTVENVVAAQNVPVEYEIVVVSLSSKKTSKNIQVVFKKGEEYLTFEDIIKLDIKPENIKVLMGETENNPKAESSATGTYHPEGGSGVEHKFDKDPLFVCRNNEYSQNDSFSSKYPNAGFMKIHCQNNFEDNKDFTVKIENVPKASFKDGTIEGKTFNN